MLQIKHLNKYFGENHVLKDISLEIESHKTMDYHRFLRLRKIHIASMHQSSGNTGFRNHKPGWKSVGFFQKTSQTSESCLYQENRHGFPELQSLSAQNRP